MQKLNRTIWHFLGVAFLFATAAAVDAQSRVDFQPAVASPEIVAVPPADAGRGLIRVDGKEIRHYGGKGATQFLQSLDNGESWKLVDLPGSYPPATCLAKESPSIVRNPNTGEFLRVEPLYRKKNLNEFMYMSSGGLDGQWNPILNEDGNPVLLSGILRTPIWVNNNQRILIPAHGGGCWTWYSDDQGQTWSKSNKVNSPAHKVGGVHQGTRWNHGMVEGTIVELTNGKLWMIARTAQDQHYETFSDDFGKTWSPAKPSRFWGTITMPTFFRMKDGRLLLLWSNTTALPEVKRAKKHGGEDVFTNRDTIHAAISEDDGQTWIGFRELILDEHRNKENYAVTKGSNDRGKHQSEVIQLDENRVLFSCGQHPLHRKLMIMDVRWLYETQRRCVIANQGSQDWSTHQYIDKIVGHCGYNRTPGAQPENGALTLRRVDDSRLTNPNQGATWNFPTAQMGGLTTTIRLNEGSAGVQICLTDRWFNPTDDTVDQFANYVLKIDHQGKVVAPGQPHHEEQLLTPGKKHELTLQWDNQSKECRLSVDGKLTGVRLNLLHPGINGISYVHFYSFATDDDEFGTSIFETEMESLQPVQAPAKRPNIVYIVTDDAGYDDFGFTGCKDWETPNIDRIARRGIIFTDAYVTASVCGPSRAGLITGRYQQSFGHEENLTGGLAKPVPQDEFGLPLEIPTLGTLLKQRGYTTGVFGKWHLGEHDNFHPNERGFDHFVGFLGGHRSFWPIEKKPLLGQQLFRNRTPVVAPEYLTDHLGKEAAKFIESNREKPFFVYLAYNAVHSPLQATDADLKTLEGIGDEKRRVLGAMTIALDRSVGHVLDSLRQNGLEDRTLVVFTNDNGAATYLKTNNAGLRGRKGTVWEGGLRVPFCASWPGVIPENSRSATPVNTLDAAYSFCKLAGFSEKQIQALKFDGCDLLAAAAGKRFEDRALYWRRGNTSAIRKNDWKLIVLKGVPTFLFNVAVDPNETTNLLDSESEIGKSLHTQLQAWDRELPQPLWRKQASDSYDEFLLKYWK